MGLVIQSAHGDGIIQQKYVVTNPDSFPNIPASLSGLTKAIYQISPNVQAPYTVQMAATLERQITKTASVTLSYIGSRGVHQLISENINAPAPGAVAGPDGIFPRPNGRNENIYQYQSAGIFKQNQLMINSNVRVRQYISLFGYYALSYANSNTAGSGSFPSVPGDLSADYGRASFDVRHRAMIGGTISLPHGFRLSPFILASSGRPYNVTTGTDLNNDSIYNDRPWFSNGCGSILGQTVGNVHNTALGCFSTVSDLSKVPINFGEGPGAFMTNLRVSKTFGFGRKAEGNKSASAGGPPGAPGEGHGDRSPGGAMITPLGGRPPATGGGASARYSVTFSASARNLFNNVNGDKPSGNLSSSNFGKSTAITNMGFFSTSANRRIDFQVQFSF
jgi:hypothetical protein